MSWTWREDAGIAGTDEEIASEMERRRPLIDLVARQLSDLRREREQEGFLRQSYIEEHGHAPGEDYDADTPPEEIAAQAARLDLERRRRENDERFLEDELNRLGARMMRRYEHWNEDEKLIEYLERDR